MAHGDRTCPLCRTHPSPVSTPEREGVENE
jgi:hypothetical protein